MMELSHCHYLDLINKTYEQILARDGEQNENETWINLIGDLAGCVSIKRPKEVTTTIRESYMSYY